MMGRIFCRAAVAALAMQAGIAAAQGLSPTASVSANGAFLWVDGAHRSINLPTYSLGAHTVDPATFADLGPVQTFKPRVTAEAINGGIGFVVPEGRSAATLGSNLRIALTGGYIRADAKQTAYANTSAPIQMWLDGTLFPGCGCEYSINLATEYSGWRFGINAASDLQIGSVTFTPSIEVVTGTVRVRQTLTQLDSFEVYNSYIKLKWSDLGIKLGMSATMPISPMFEFGASGTMAVVHRRASLIGNDMLADLVAGPLLATFVDTSEHTWAIVPAAQVQFIFIPASQVQIRAFGGVEWDSRVPGIVSPHFTPDQFFTLTGSPATIGFSGQTSYFVGGGLTYAFNR